MIIKKSRIFILEIALEKQVPVFVVDEDHLLKKDIINQLHTLSQFIFDSNNILPMVLCGQYQLIDKLMILVAKPLVSRFVGRSHMENLKLKDMKGYIEYHLRLVSCENKSDYIR